MNYGYKRELSLSFDEATEKTKEELKKEGFGVLTEINVKDTFKKKLDIEYDNYIILGACNPQFAHKALESEKEIGLLLPCNVIIYEEDGVVFVSAIVPTVAMSVVDNDDLANVAVEVEWKIKRAVDNIN